MQTAKNDLTTNYSTVLRMSSKWDNSLGDSESNPSIDNQWIKQILQDPTKKAFILWKLRLEDMPSLRQGAKLAENGNPPLISMVERMVVILTPLTFPRHFATHLWTRHGISPAFSNTMLEIGGAALTQFPPAQFLPAPLGVNPFYSFGKVPEVLIGKMDNEELGITGGRAVIKSDAASRGAQRGCVMDLLEEAESLQLIEFDPKVVEGPSGNCH